MWNHTLVLVYFQLDLRSFNTSVWLKNEEAADLLEFSLRYGIADVDIQEYWAPSSTSLEKLFDLVYELHCGGIKDARVELFFVLLPFGKNLSYYIKFETTIAKIKLTQFVLILFQIMDLNQISTLKSCMLRKKVHKLVN